MSSKPKSSSSKAKDTGKDKKQSSSAKKGGNASRVVELLESYHKKESEKTMEDCSKLISTIKTTLTGDDQAASNGLGQDVTQCDFFIPVLEHYAKLPTDSRKDIVTISSKLLKQNNVVEHLVTTPQVITFLITNCENPLLSMNSHLILIEFIRYEPLAKICLQLENFLPLFALIQDANFDVAANSFGTFKELLTKHKSIAATFLDTNYDQVFGKYKELLVSANYVTKRTSLKLLGELLLDRANFHVMTKYISQSSNLKLMMSLLVDGSKNIQFEAFHVFKVFVANPKKPQAVQDILVQNKARLIEYLTDFHNDRSEDDQFCEEKQYLIKQIQSL